jgi:hypothetical protein
MVLPNEADALCMMSVQLVFDDRLVSLCMAMHCA